MVRFAILPLCTNGQPTAWEAGRDSSQVPFDFAPEILQNIMYDRTLTISKQANWAENNS